MPRWDTLETVTPLEDYEHFRRRGGQMWINCFEVSGKGGGKRRLGGSGVVRPRLVYLGIGAMLRVCRALFHTGRDQSRAGIVTHAGITYREMCGRAIQKSIGLALDPQVRRRQRVPGGKLEGGKVGINELRRKIGLSV